MHWWLIIEDYGPKILYFTVQNNVVIDVLSKIPTMDKVPHKTMYQKTYRKTIRVHKT